MNQTTNTPTGIALDLTKLEALARAATPGPWHNHPISDDDCYTVGLSVHSEAAKYPLIDEDHMPGMKDAEFIAAANPATVLELIELARRSTSGSDLVKCETCNGEGGTITSTRMDPETGPEHTVEYCTDCGGIGRVEAQQASGSDGTAAAGQGRLADPVSVERFHDGVSEVAKTRYRLCTCAAPSPSAEAVRDQVLEEAAQECLRHSDDNPHYKIACIDCADAIRAMKRAAMSQSKTQEAK